MLPSASAIPSGLGCRLDTASETSHNCCSHRTHKPGRCRPDRQAKRCPVPPRPDSGLYCHRCRPEKVIRQTMRRYERQLHPVSESTNALIRRRGKPGPVDSYCQQPPRELRWRAQHSRHCSYRKSRWLHQTPHPAWGPATEGSYVELRSAHRTDTPGPLRIPRWPLEPARSRQGRLGDRCSCPPSQQLLKSVPRLAVLDDRLP